MCLFSWVKLCKTRLLFFATSLFAGIAYANCTFVVANYSNYPVTVTVGYYHGNRGEMVIQGSKSGQMMIKDKQSCLATTEAGLGVVYANLTGVKGSGGWVYVPSANMLRAVGGANGSNRSSIGATDDGHDILLINNYKPDEGTFSVVISQANRNQSKNGSMI